MSSINYRIKFADTNGVMQDDYDMECRPRTHEIVSDEYAVVIIVGWYGSKSKYLDKYGDMYKNMGCTVIQYIPPMDQLFSHHEILYDHAREILELLEELDLKKSPVLFHIFSNMGCIVYLKFCCLLQHSNEFKDVRVVGTVFDSCPGKPRLRSAARAIMYGANMKQSSLAPALEFLLMLVLFFYINFMHFKQFLTNCFRPPPCCNKWNFHENVIRYSLPCSHLFLYSKIDQLIWYRDIEEVVDKLRRERNVNVGSTYWEDAQHVALYKQHPESYMKHCDSFLENCVSGT